MKKLLGTVVVFAGMTLGISNANATTTTNPTVTPDYGCTFFNGNGDLEAIFSPTDVHARIVTKRSGTVTAASCRANVTGPDANFDFSTKPIACLIITPGEVTIQTNNWHESIVDGVAHLKCRSP